MRRNAIRRSNRVLLTSGTYYLPIFAFHVASHARYKEFRSGQGSIGNVINGSMAMMATHTPTAAKTMSGEMVHFRATMLARCGRDFVFINRHKRRAVPHRVASQGNDSL